MIKYLTLPLQGWFISVMWVALTGLTIKTNNVFYEWLIICGILLVVYGINDLYKFSYRKVI